MWLSHLFRQRLFSRNQGQAQGLPLRYPSAGAWVIRGTVLGFAASREKPKWPAGSKAISTPLSPGTERSLPEQNRLGEGEKLIEVLFDDGDDDGQLKCLVFVNRNVAEPNHAFHLFREWLVNPAGLCQEGEDVARALWNAQSLSSHQVMAHIERRLTGSLNMEDRRILSSMAAAECRLVVAILLPDPGDAALDRRRLVDQKVIGHGRCPVA